MFMRESVAPKKAEKALLKNMALTGTVILAAQNFNN
jgi:hypothetical protein